MDTSERRFESEIEYWLTTQGSDLTGLRRVTRRVLIASCACIQLT